MNRKLIALLSIFILSHPLFADGVRTNIGSVTVLDPENPETSITMRYNDAVGITLPESWMFIKGVEFELRIPAGVMGFESSIQWSIYSRVTPEPALEEVDYEGYRLAAQPLPARVSIILKLPMAERHDLRSDAFATVIPVITKADQFPILFKLSAIGKGFPPNLEKAEFRLIIRPIIGDEGGININTLSPENMDWDKLNVFLDDKRVDDPASIILAKKGLRILRVSAPGFREEIISLSITAGRISPVNIHLVPDVPRMTVQAPAGTIISLDGQILGSDQLIGYAIEPGEHTVTCRIGDYTMTRKFTALRGKVYTIVLNVGLEINSQP